ncbi:YIEGIA family protein [Brevibacillus sp. B_LB10_24]|uniref:YIEGIA family protein n=1 Tax=Brevibacillus sp. B_LB10_24 TaxID=3380645 RepID=UPI0038BAF840
MLKQLLANEYFIPLFIGFGFGVLTRVLLLRTDYRQYPTSPHGKIIHLSLGIIASSLGAVAVPALLKENYTAITFLTVAAQQFRDVRKMERDTLTEVDQHELVPRGGSYIEGIAMAFEGRNYLVIFVAFVTTFAAVLFAWWGGLIAGIVTMGIGLKFKSGKTLGHIVDIVPAEVHVDDNNLSVGDIYIMNIGSEEAQEQIRQHGMGFILVPKNQNAKVTIANLGQRQAILHDTATMLGVYRDDGEPSLVPMAKRDLRTGRIGLFLLPMTPDVSKAEQVIVHVPLLEYASRIPKEAPINQTAPSNDQ